MERLGQSSCMGRIWPRQHVVALLTWSKLMPWYWLGWAFAIGVSNSYQLIAHEVFTLWETAQSSTFRELAGVIMCILSFITICVGARLVIHADNQNVLWIQGKGSRYIPINDLAVELRRLCVKYDITYYIIWVPRDRNVHADTLWQFWTPGTRCYTACIFRCWAPQTVDLFANKQ